MVLLVRPDPALARVNLLRLYLVAAFKVLSQAGVVPAIVQLVLGYNNALSLHRLILCGL